MGGAEDEGTGRVGEAAGTLATDGVRFEDTGVGASVSDRTGGSAWTIGEADEAAEDSAEGSTDDISGFVWREMDGPVGPELEAQAIEFEGQCGQDSTLTEVPYGLVVRPIWLIAKTGAM